VTGSPVCTVKLSAPLTWRAHDGDALVGTLFGWLRPDRRWAVWFEACRDDYYEPLLAMAVGDLRHDLYASADETDDDALAVYGRLGFEVTRREGNIVIPVGARPAGEAALAAGRTALAAGGAALAAGGAALAAGGAALAAGRAALAAGRGPALAAGRGVALAAGRTAPALPDGIRVISAADADEDRLRVLDGALREDVPGGDGWRWDPADFRAETYESDEFDPATYLVAVDQADGEYAGLVRIWMRPTVPKLGLIALLPPYRGRGLAKALVGAALDGVSERGVTEVVADVDDTNAACTGLLASFGGRRDGGTVELVWRFR
jgi:ribosomal protein S18 acetylase RimI-like enzyme